MNRSRLDPLKSWDAFVQYGLLEHTFVLHLYDPNLSTLLEIQTFIPILIELYWRALRIIMNLDSWSMKLCWTELRWCRRQNVATWSLPSPSILSSLGSNHRTVSVFIKMFFVRVSHSSRFWQYSSRTWATSSKSIMRSSCRFLPSDSCQRCKFVFTWSWDRHLFIDVTVTSTRMLWSILNFWFEFVKGIERDEEYLERRYSCSVSRSLPGLLLSFHSLCLRFIIFFLSFVLSSFLSYDLSFISFSPSLSLHLSFSSLWQFSQCTCLSNIHYSTRPQFRHDIRYK